MNEYKSGMVVKTNDMLTLYRVLRMDENTVWQASMKSAFTRIGVPMFIDPEISWCTGIWAQMIRFANAGRRN